jgi:hypothetical protein
MTSWQISESAISVALRDDGRGELTFTVTNTGRSPDRAVLTITALAGAAESWFTVDEPQRPVGPGVSVVYEVAVAAPPGTPAGTYAATGVVYSADADPSESSATSKRIELVLAVARPEAGAPRWPYLVAAAAVVLVAAVVAAIVLTRGGDDEADLQVVTTPACEVIPLFAGDYLFQVDVGVSSTGPTVADGSVPVRLRNERTGAETVGNVTVTQGPNPAPTAFLSLGIPEVDMGRVESYSLVVDPDELVPESDDTNNEATVLIELFGTGPMPCSKA